MVTRAAIYQDANASWPKPLPKLTDAEARRSARRLFRFVGLTCPSEVRIVTGNRHSWVRGGVLSLNPSRGWDYHVHLLSHWFHRKLQPGEKPHAKTHARLERRLIREVARRGWLDGRLRDWAKTPAVKAVDRAEQASKLAAKLAHAEQMQKRAITRTRRAHTLLRKWNLKVAGIRRQIDRANAAPATISP